VNGGVGEAVTRLASERGLGTSLCCLGVPDRFLPQASRDELLARCGLDGEAIAREIENLVTAGLSRRARGSSALTPGEPHG